MPCFWVLTCHGRVLVLCGTMSLNEIASDLTCEPAISRDDDLCLAHLLSARFVFPPHGEEASVSVACEDFGEAMESGLEISVG